MKTRKISFLLFLLLALAMTLALVSCGESDPGVVYEVKVVDAFGKPVPNMVVNILGEDGEEIDKKMTNSEGIVACEESDALDIKGNYKVTLVDPFGSKFYYKESECVFNNDKEKLTVTIYSEASELPFDVIYPADVMSDKGVSASIVSDGGYHVELKAGDNYFIFMPKTRGLYNFSVDAEGSLAIGYHGSPFFVQSNDLSGNDASDDVYKTDAGLFFAIRSFNIGEDYGATSRYVVKVSVDSDKDGIIRISCDPNLAMSKEELPWDIEMPDVPLTEFDADSIKPEGATLVNFDIFDKNLTVVYNSEDKFYHLGTEDGPVVMVRLTSASPYLPAIATMMETQSFAIYLYDGDNLVAKKNYHELLLDYCEAADGGMGSSSNTAGSAAVPATGLGVYPLTEELRTALINIGNAWGWYKTGSMNNIFGEDALKVVPENAYLFVCCYFE